MFLLCSVYPLHRDRRPRAPNPYRSFPPRPPPSHVDTRATVSLYLFHPVSSLLFRRRISLSLWTVASWSAPSVLQTFASGFSHSMVRFSRHRFRVITNAHSIIQTPRRAAARRGSYARAISLFVADSFASTRFRSSSLCLWGRRRGEFERFGLPVRRKQLLAKCAGTWSHDRGKFYRTEILLVHVHHCSKILGLLLSETNLIFCNQMCIAIENKANVDLL